MNVYSTLLHGYRVCSSEGWAVDADLDLTGDGLQDLLIGAPGEVRDGQPGGVYVLESPIFD